VSKAKINPNQPIGLFDMDGILADLSLDVQRFYFEATGKEFSTADLRKHDFDAELPGFKDLKYWERPNIFNNLAPIKGALEALEYLDSKVNIFILTAPTRNPMSVVEKSQWLDKYLPFVHRRRRFFGPNKWLVYGDFFVDDHVDNLSQWSKKHPQGLTYGLEYGYNKHYPGMYKSWDTLLPQIVSDLSLDTPNMSNGKIVKL